MNPFHLTGYEAVLCTAIGCGAACYIVRKTTNAGISMTITICACVKESVMAWVNAVKSRM